MAEKLKSIKVTEETIKNLNATAYFLGKKQYEVAEYASQVVWGKIEKKVGYKLPQSSKTKKV